MTPVDPGTPTWLRTRNDRTALALLLEHGPLSRSQLGRLSGMSKPTAGQMISRLEQVGLVGPVGEISESRGPNAVVYGVRSDVVAGVAVSVLEGSLEAVLTDPLGTAHPVAQVPLAGRDRSPEADVGAAVEAACRAAGADPASVTVVVVGVQAAVGVAHDELSFTDTLPGWPRRGARSRLEAATGHAVTLENDVNLATIAERATPELADADDFALLWVGEGLGVGVGVGGVVQRGAFGGAGEIGYLEVPRSAAAIDPNATDFTDLLGGAAVVRLLGGPPEEPLRSALTRLDDDVLAQLADRIALAAAPVVGLLDPGVLVLGGPTGLAGGPELAAAVKARLASAHLKTADPRDRLGRLRVLVSGSGPQPVLQGAGQLLVDDLRARLESRIGVP
ncbi:Sugar kinase of the NBD/HSP70 family, may contain an N-terminal HTH domain [Quadrisphaera granulorum]|uniref:Putative NBD/HSP70 family sugar kinase n=1 Tax=Quadrisphaera granulorum TaxID=317664 RepID=A0A316AAY5_9ACTN|nr:ROK family protein [Quadrisphaera granulorum]PWJ54014.1 putative NBD/HSP70 family sugar kinase [Quadrisphaera granulorum]SZE96471.1 Sugar kinase of the NBD/HSP70 family, may contain an N-terminal HTH domain [Quadrisphaera granulorum]